MPDHIPCPVCTAVLRDTVAATAGYELRRCGDCGLVVKIHPGSGEVDLQAERDTVYTPAALQARLGNPLFSEIAARRLDFLRQVAAPGRLLEIGCATGEFLDAAGRAGYSAEGVDSSPLFCEHLRQSGFEVHSGDFAALNLPPATYDIVAGFHLLEHIPVPAGFLEQAGALLREEGLLYLITPNTASRTGRKFGWEHPLYTEADHVCLYAPPTLRRLLEDNGWEIVALESWEPLHHFFTSLKIFLKQSRSGVRQMLGKLIKPYFLTTLLRGWLKQRAARLRKEQAGHEIVVIARKR